MMKFGLFRGFDFMFFSVLRIFGFGILGLGLVGVLMWMLGGVLVLDLELVWEDVEVGLIVLVFLIGRVSLDCLVFFFELVWYIVKVFFFGCRVFFVVELVRFLEFVFFGGCE